MRKIGLSALAIVLAGVLAGYVVGLRPASRSASVSEALAQERPDLQAPTSPATPDKLQTSTTGFVEPLIDLGEVRWGRELRVPLLFRNAASEALEVTRVSASCDCTVLADEADYAGRRVASQGILPIDVLFRTGDKPGMRASRVALATTAGAEYAMHIKAVVVGTWKLSADTVRFGKVRLDLDEDPVQTVQFSSSSADVRLLDAPKSRLAWLRCTTQPATDGGTSLVFQARHDQLNIGATTTAVEVETNDPDVPKRLIYVTAKGVLALEAYPSNVHLLPGHSQHVHFVDASGNRVKVQRVREPDGPVRVRIDDEGGLVAECTAELQKSSPWTMVDVYDESGRHGRFYVRALATGE